METEEGRPIVFEHVDPDSLPVWGGVPVMEAARAVVDAERLRWESAVLRVGDGEALRLNVIDAIHRLGEALAQLDSKKGNK